MDIGLLKYSLRIEVSVLCTEYYKAFIVLIRAVGFIVTKNNCVIIFSNKNFRECITKLCM